MKFRFITPLLLLSVLFVVETQAQCAMCKAVAESGGERMAEGLNSGIMYLMVVPYVIIAIIGSIIFRKQLSDRFKLILNR